ncbi:MAG: TetR/AcrR family transcriptional regulator, partial [Clostridia bacterium]|nr:TetR/AcrR family transcriptional regulator [Clostridia bacterium]
MCARKTTGPAAVIERKARLLFLEKGFAKTSYQDIAKVCGVEKTNVQKHFPHKDLFIDHFFEDLLDYSDEFFAKRDMLPNDYYQALYLVGQIHFAFLLSTPELRRLTLDIVSDRKLTEAMISQDVSWATKYLEGFSLEEQQTFSDNVAVVMGGKLFFSAGRDGQSFAVYQHKVVFLQRCDEIHVHQQSLIAQQKPFV